MPSALRNGAILRCRRQSTVAARPNKTSSLASYIILQRRVSSPGVPLEDPALRLRGRAGRGEREHRHRRRSGGPEQDMRRSKRASMTAPGGLTPWSASQASELLMRCWTLRRGGAAELSAADSTPMEHNLHPLPNLSIDGVVKRAFWFEGKKDG